MLIIVPMNVCGDIMIRITYEEGNGYECGCCSDDRLHTEDFNTEEEVIEWLSQVEAGKKFHDDKITVIDILEIKGKLNLSHNTESVSKIVKSRNTALSKDKQKKERAKQEKEKEQLKKLSEKYPEVKE